MKVCIVCGGVNGDDNRILHRLARLLAERTGWALQERPDCKADVNYFLPYLDVPNDWEQPPGSKAAGWFTHRDTTISGKAAVWDARARTLALRTTSARRNLPGLQACGPTAYVTPPLDREKFRPAPKQARNRPIVGVSGFCYRGGRKGEALVRGLLAEPISQRVQWRAAGRGWPITTKQVPWAELEAFYQQLDVYLLTSTIEGVGYGPLEALACGVPVVVPRGVGIMDELPDVPGIERYTPGDALGLRNALEKALDQSYSVDALRAATAPYTAEAWAADHLHAFAAAFAPAPACVPAPEPLPDWRGRAGLYVVAYGEPARRCAANCIKQWHKHMPGVPVALCSDRPLGPEDVLVQEPEHDIGARLQKIRVWELAPAEWQYVAYMDADAEAVAPVPALFDWLRDGWELCICKNPGKFHLAANMGRKDNSGECKEVFALYGTDQMMQWNGGVFSFRRCEATQALFRRWEWEWQRYGKRDQGALLRALWHTPVRAWWLGNEWNLVPTYDPVDRSAGIVHHPMTARRWEGIIGGRSDSPEAWEAVRQWERQNKQEVAR